MMVKQLLSNKYNKCCICKKFNANRYYRFKVKSSSYALCEKCMYKIEEYQRLKISYENLDTEEYLSLHYDFDSI